MKGLYTRGATWWLRFTPLPGTPQERYSLGTTDEAQAIVIAQQIIERVSSQARQRAENCEAEINAYLAAMRHEGLAKSTLSSRSYVLRGFVADLAVVHPKSITPGMVLRWFERRRKAYEQTAVAYLNVVRYWLKWLVAANKLPTNPANAIKLPKLRMRRRRSFLLPDQARALLSACLDDDDMRYAIFCAMHQGLRKQEVIESIPAFFDLQEGLLHIQATPTFEPKDRDCRTIPLTTEFRAWLTTHYGLRTPFMFRPSAKHGAARYRSDFVKSFAAIKRRAGLNHITFHDLRRTFASLLVSSGVSIYKVAVWLGDDVATVQDTYGHLIPQDVEVNKSWERRPVEIVAGEARAGQD